MHPLSPISLCNPLVLSMGMVMVVAIKKKARVTTTKAIRIQGAIIAIQLKIKISMLIGVCLHELFMVILFSRGLVFNVHFLLVLTFPLKVIIHLKGL